MRGLPPHEAVVRPCATLVAWRSQVLATAAVGDMALCLRCRARRAGIRPLMRFSCAGAVSFARAALAALHPRNFDAAIGRTPELQRVAVAREWRRCPCQGPSPSAHLCVGGQSLFGSPYRRATAERHWLLELRKALSVRAGACVRRSGCPPPISGGRSGRAGDRSVALRPAPWLLLRGQWPRAHAQSAAAHTPLRPHRNAELRSALRRSLCAAPSVTTANSRPRYTTELVHNDRRW